MLSSPSAVACRPKTIQDVEDVGLAADLGVWHCRGLPDRLQILTVRGSRGKEAVQVLSRDRRFVVCITSLVSQVAHCTAELFGTGGSVNTTEHLEFCLLIRHVCCKLLQGMSFSDRIGIDDTWSRSGGGIHTSADGDLYYVEMIRVIWRVRFYTLPSHDDCLYLSLFPPASSRTRSE